MEQPRTHPIFLAAGAAVLLFSLLGAAALTGVLPASNSSTPAESAALAHKTAAATPAAHPSQRMTAGPCMTCGVIESVRAGGAYAGNEIERNVNRRTVWRVAVRLDDGSLRTLSQKAQPPFAVGERVRIVDGAMERA